jgi:hypothetical protein
LKGLSALAYASTHAPPFFILALARSTQPQEGQNGKNNDNDADDVENIHTALLWVKVCANSCG